MRRSDSGFSMVEVLIAAGLMGIVASVMASLFITMNKSQQQLNMTISLGYIQYTFANTVKNQTAWQNTYQLAENNDLDCVKNNTDCRAIFTTIGAGQGVAIRLKDASNQDIFNTYNSLDTTHGFGFDGQPCTQFDAVAGSDRCPVRVAVLWKPLCPPLPAACVSPQSQISVQFDYKPQTLNPINPTRYNTTLVQSLGDVDVAINACTAIGGTYNVGLGVCNFATINQNVGQSCAAGSFVAGFNADGSMNCQVP